MKACDHCGKQFKPKGVGRPPRFCSGGCRTAAHRLRANPYVEQVVIPPPTRPLRVLVGCEHTGVVRDAFTALGHEAMSCDLLPDESPEGGWHYQGDVRDAIGEGWDLAIMHPPCTYLALVGVQHLHTQQGRWEKLLPAASFFRWCLDADVPRVAVENPVMHGYAQQLVGRNASQFIEPWQHGHPYTKSTGLWLRNLPRLLPTDIVEPTGAWTTEVRDWKRRSRTFAGVGQAMARQWGGAIVKDLASAGSLTA